MNSAFSAAKPASHIMALLSRLTMPIVTTLHTVLAEPTPAQRGVMDRIVDASSTVVVMAEKGRELLRTVYGVPAEKIEVMPHGIPDFPFVEPDQAKAELGFSGRAVILTFGLLSPNKGIEVMIDAMPSILKSRPDAVYVVLGATHPNLVRRSRRGLPREPCGARASARSRGPCRVSRPVRRPGDAARLHLDVRRLRHALSQRGADDVGHVGLQLRAGKGGRFDALLARAGIAGRRARHSGSLWRCRGHRQRDRGIADRRCPAAGHAQARLREQPLDDMGANRGALPCRFRKCPARASAQGGCAARPKRALHATATLRQRCRSVIFCPCATTPGCSSMRSIRCPIAPTAIASTTMPARCCWPVRSTTQVSSACPKP